MRSGKSCGSEERNGESDDGQKFLPPAPFFLSARALCHFVKKDLCKVYNYNIKTKTIMNFGRVAELVYAYVSEAYGAILGSSNLPSPTKTRRMKRKLGALDDCVLAIV